MLNKNVSSERRRRIIIFNLKKKRMNERKKKVYRSITSVLCNIPQNALKMLFCVGLDGRVQVVFVIHTRLRFMIVPQICE